MFQQLFSIILALALLVSLFGSAGSLSAVEISIGSLILISLAVNLKRWGFSWPHLLLPVVFLLGVNSVFIILPNSTLRFVFLVISAILFYLVQIQLGQQSHFLQNIYLLSVFAIMLGIFAIQFYFHLNAGWLTLAVFAASYMLIVQGFAGFSLPAKKFFSLIIALVCAEIAWGVSLWPTYFLVDAVVVFVTFYLLWFFSFSAFFGRLNRKKIYWQLALVIFVIVLTLSTATWGPLVK